MTSEDLPEHVRRGGADVGHPHGEWVRLLRANDFEIEDLIEIRPPDGSSTSYPFVTLDWARRWPSEEVWKARKRG